MLRVIRDAARGKEVEVQGCGPVMRRLMELYRFRPFAGHPRQADLSLGLIEAQRSTLCLVVAHMLLGAVWKSILRCVHAIDTRRVLSLIHI